MPPKVSPPFERSATPTSAEPGRHMSPGVPTGCRPLGTLNGVKLQAASLRMASDRRHATMLVVVLVALLVTLVVPAPDASGQAVARVVISEVHYHPAPVGTVFPGFDDRENTEFVEVLNLESSAVDVSGWCPDRGVDFCFPSGTVLAPSST